MSNHKSDISEAAEALSQAFEAILHHGAEKGFCPACFALTLAHAIIDYDQTKGLEHVEALRGVGIACDPIGETEGNA